MDTKAGVGIGAEADIAVAGVRFNPAIKSGIYSEHTEIQKRPAYC